MEVLEKCSNYRLCKSIQLNSYGISENIYCIQEYKSNIFGIYSWNTIGKTKFIHHAEFFYKHKTKCI